MYLAALRLVKKVCPGFNPRHGMADWERTSRAAFLFLFPRLILIGCFFHYVQVTIESYHDYNYIDRMQRVFFTLQAVFRRISVTGMVDHYKKNIQFNR